MGLPIQLEDKLTIEHKRKWWKTASDEEIKEEILKRKRKVNIIIGLLLFAVLIYFLMGFLTAKVMYDNSSNQIYMKNFRNSLAEELCQLKFNESFSGAGLGTIKKIIFCDNSHFSVDNLE